MTKEKVVATILHCLAMWIAIGTQLKALLGSEVGIFAFLYRTTDVLVSSQPRKNLLNSFSFLAKARRTRLMPLS